MKKKHTSFDRNRLKLRSLSERKHKMHVSDIPPLEVSETCAVSLRENTVNEMRDLIGAIQNARENGKPVILMMGAHALRRGNSRVFIDMMRRGFLTHLATNGAVPIHDAELAMVGGTLEDVEYYLRDGSFGNWSETGRIINETVNQAVPKGYGFGEAIAKRIFEGDTEEFPHKDISIFAAAYSAGIPITVHKGIGQDITDQHPSADYGALGEATGRDFLVFAESVSKLEGGGVFLNVGSEVFGPEVYLKALSMARNVAAQEGRTIKNFTTAVFDIVPLGNWREEHNIVNYRNPLSLKDPRYYFRPMKSILIRTVREGGHSYYIEGDFQDTIPALYRALIA